MSEFREQAIKDVAEALQVDPEVIRFQIGSGKVSGRSYAVDQREARLRLEDILRYGQAYLHPRLGVGETEAEAWSDAASKLLAAREEIAQLKRDEDERIDALNQLRLSHTLLLKIAIGYLKICETTGNSHEMASDVIAEAEALEGK